MKQMGEEERESANYSSTFTSIQANYQGMLFTICDRKKMKENVTYIQAKLTKKSYSLN